MEQNPCDTCRNTDCARLVNPCDDRLWYAHTKLRWIPVSDRMPETGVMVLACFRNKFDEHRRIRAMYAAPKTLESALDDEGGEYDEEADIFWANEGWYEANEYEETHWRVDGRITHWMELPPPPVEVFSDGG